MSWRSRVGRASLLLAAGLAQAGSAASEPTRDASVAGAGPVVDLQPYLSDLSDHLARSSNPRDLLLAARLMSSPDTSREQEASLLVSRALGPGVTDPLVWWWAATNCNSWPVACESSAAVTKVQAVAPSNAAVWMLTRDRDQTRTDSNPDDPGGDADLDRMAAASRTDLYLGDGVRSSLAAFDQRPLPEAISRGGVGSDPSLAADIVRGVMAFELAMAMGPVSFPHVSRLCDDATVARLGAPRRARCIAAMRNVASKADSMHVERLANRVLVRLLEPGRERDAALRAATRASWQTDAWMKLQIEQDRVGKGSIAIADKLALWREPGATELKVVRKQLEAAGIALDPPPDWVPSRPIDPPPITDAD